MHTSSTNKKGCAFSEGSYHPYVRVSSLWKQFCKLHAKICILVSTEPKREKSQFFIFYFFAIIIILFYFFCDCLFQGFFCAGSVKGHSNLEAEPLSKMLLFAVKFLSVSETIKVYHTTYWWGAVRMPVKLDYCHGKAGSCCRPGKVPDFLLWNLTKC